MGRSTACFKIIACGGSSIEEENAEAPENNGSSDKRGWSFRKRSARHRVLSNTVISEVSTSLNKEGPETATINLQTQPNTNFPEKSSTVPWTDETPQILTSVEKASDTTVAKGGDTQQGDVKPDESAMVVIQAAVRSFLAQREMLKLKNVVKVQAAVRGRLVRRQAVGTLRCIQAIIKMQALVRARRARLKFEASNTVEKLHEEKENLVVKPNAMYISTEKLLSNKFANMLMESAPQTKHIHVKCDPYRSDSTWNWLERWMSVSSVGIEQPQKPESKIEILEQDKVECAVYQLKDECPSEVCESVDFKADVQETRSEDNLITYEADDFDFQAGQRTSSSKSEDLESPQPDTSGKSNSKEISLDLLHGQTMQSDSISRDERYSISSKPETESEQSTRSLKRPAPEQVENEGKTFVFGNKKATNPAFIAAQSKFEELSSTADSVRSASANTQDVGVESNTDAVSSVMDKTSRTKDIGLAENSMHTPLVRLGGSECGTELSISSTLDSSESSEIGVVVVEREAEVSEEGTGRVINSTKNLDIQSNHEKTIPASDVSYSIPVQQEKLDNVNDATDEPINSVTAVESLQEKLNSETNAFAVQIEHKSEMDCQTYKSSPEASPRSHMTVPESQGTPASQVSVKAGRTKSNKGASNHKRRSLSSVRRSPSNPINESCVSNSVEQLPKDHKTGKRRNSFGSGRPDCVDQEPRDSCSSNSLPNYMQATESARAKALANSSPRSSPDVHDKEIYNKKRQSLPGANAKQGSPRTQQSTSRAQQGAKGNGHLHDRKWQR